MPRWFEYFSMVLGEAITFREQHRRAVREVLATIQVNGGEAGAVLRERQYRAVRQLATPI